MCATHTHSGPNNRISNESPSKDVVDYVRILKEKIISGVEEAHNNRQPATIGADKGKCNMNINRRADDGNGKITLGRNPYGVCDHSVGVVRIDNSEGVPIAILINWSSHAATMGPNNYLISGDWPGSAARYIEKVFDNKIIAPIIIGSCGNVNPIYGPHLDFSMAYAYGIDAIGSALCEETVCIAKDIKTTVGQISAVQRIINLPGKEAGSSDKSTESAPDFKMRLSALKIGDVVFTGIAQEFAEIGLKIKEASPYKNTFIVDHCNASSEYVPTDEAYEEGGYEVGRTHIKKGGEKIIIKSVLEMIDEL